MARFLALAALALLGGCSAAQDALTASEAVAFLKLDPAAAHSTESEWNGRPVVFVDHVTGTGEQEFRLDAVYRDDAGQLRSAEVVRDNSCCTTEAAVGPANADGDPDEELIVILRGSVSNYDVSGSLYEVRLFDALRPGEPSLAPLSQLSAHFGSECDCEWRDGTRKTFAYKTVAAVQRELARLGR